MSDMGTFRIDVEVENPARPGQRRRVEHVLVDTSAELSWIPAGVLEALGIERFSELRFPQANGTIVDRRSRSESRAAPFRCLGTRFPLLRHDLVDRYRLILYPLILGSGTPYFKRADRTKTFRLVNAQPTDSGVVMLTYRLEMT